MPKPLASMLSAVIMPFSRAHVIMTEKKTEGLGKVWATRIKVLLISGILASIANMIYEWRTHAATIHMPWEVFPALLYMFIIVIVSCLLHDLMTGTVVADYGSQKIFKSTEDLIAYQKMLAADRARRQTY